jgi:hypothetical protein
MILTIDLLLKIDWYIIHCVGYQQLTNFFREIKYENYGNKKKDR